MSLYQESCDPNYCLRWRYRCLRMVRISIWMNLTLHPFFACLVISANFFCCDCLKSMRFNGGAAHVFVVGYIVNHHFFFQIRYKSRSQNWTPFKLKCILYTQINTWPFLLSGIIPTPAGKPETQSKADVGRVMIAGLIWICIHLLIIYFRLIGFYGKGKIRMNA